MLAEKAKMLWSSIKYTHADAGRKSKDVVIFNLSGSMQMLAKKQGCCDLQFKWIHADAGRKSKDVVIFNFNGFMEMLAGKARMLWSSI